MAKSKSRKKKRLSRRQLLVIDDLFNAGLGEPAVLRKHGVSNCIFRKWLADDVFGSEVRFRTESAHRQSRLIIAQYLPVAAAKLVQLTESEKEETARRACLDIISLPIGAAEGEKRDCGKGETTDEPLPAGLASRLLSVLAEEQQGT